MTEIVQSIKINAPVGEVFNYVSDYQNWEEFYDGISNVKPITENTKTIGSKFIYTIKTMGIPFTVGTEFRNFVKNEGWTGKSFKGVEHRTQWLFKEVDGITEFTHAVSYRLPLYFGGSLFDVLFMRSAWKKTIDRSLQNLKRIMEST